MYYSVNPKNSSEIRQKGRISKRVFQEKQSRSNFLKTNISYPLIRTRTCAYQGVRKVCFSENLACFVFLKHPFGGLFFCLITDEFAQGAPEILRFKNSPKMMELI